ncbi:3-oxoacyl-ACP synthase III family protein [Thermomonospora cellulosilytica]|uniref:3-oxoacyl-[acyl-carrier-protein] synthase-3 n=1 Tax=Thermomonospora cellulosilytica TaxID=1411118 RepID=A0A7W3RAU3_9ACTN|nr:3-oxoacyl-[acyl-carrier-protein] synthase III C-terminal domain-containing protein [Thermomonospora cellulosilytica]MBA9006778.1 3-oxoacyl-[acyl-carrier-protein] synthase-3 [Thermomonospora cellulosilytica]
MTAGVFVDSWVYALGERKMHVAESAAAGRLLSDPADLESAGFRYHHVCEPGTGAYDLARAAAVRLREAGELDEVDAIVYATCIPANANTGDAAAWERTRDVKHLMDFPASRLQADLDLDEAVVIGLNQQACTAMLGSLRVAGAMLGAEPGWRRVLCVTADRFPEGARYEQAYNLISDGAAACVVSRRPAGLRLVAAHQITNGALGTAGDDETVGSYFAYTHRLVRQTLDRAGLTPGDVDWVVTQNTNDKAWRILARLLGIDHDRVWSPSLPDTGHIISADNVVNLSMLLESGRVRPGQRIVLVMAGFGLNWQCVVLEAAADLRPPVPGATP